MVSLAIILSSFAIYHTACLLVESIGSLDQSAQSRFESLLFQYLLIFCLISIFIGSFLHFYLTKNLIKPIRSMIISTEELKSGGYPEPVAYSSNNEVGQLISQYNDLISQLKSNTQTRDKMISDLSHELRTPVSNLSGYLYAIKSGDIDPDKAIYDSLYQESIRLKRLITQIDQLKELDYFAVQNYMDKQRTEITEHIQHCLDTFKWSYDSAKIPLESSIQSCNLKVNIEGIQQVISNLLDNALHYHQTDSAVKVKGEEHGENYRISVISQGEEIAANEQKSIFERFYRMDQSRTKESGGSGLGLAIAKEIVEKHNGEIGVISSENVNEFWFTIPKPNYKA